MVTLVSLASAGPATYCAESVEYGSRCSDSCIRASIAVRRPAPTL